MEKKYARGEGHSSLCQQKEEGKDQKEEGAKRLPPRRKAEGACELKLSNLALEDGQKRIQNRSLVSI